MTSRARDCAGHDRSRRLRRELGRSGRRRRDRGKRAVGERRLVWGSGVYRYYDPQTGQFLTIDPLVDQTDQAYEYAGQDPTNSYDLDGADPECTPCGWNLTGKIGDVFHSAVKSSTVRMGLAGLAAAACPETAGFGCALAVGMAAGAGLGATNYAVNSNDHSAGGYAKETGIGGLEGALAGFGTAAAAGKELEVGGRFRIAPGGNRGPGYFQKPHYHRLITGSDGETLPGGSMKWHRPWQKGW
jgi:RHS repeat-associated protein